MCKWDTHEIMLLNGKKRYIDSCLASVIREMNLTRIKTLASCCGHYKNPGIIRIQNGEDEVDIILPQLKEM